MCWARAYVLDTAHTQVDRNTQKAIEFLTVSVGRRLPQ
jgi:hypothetical protein